MTFCVRESDEPGPADLLQPGGEATHLHRAVHGEREVGEFDAGTALA